MIREAIATALARPASRVVEGTVRTIVAEVLQEHGYASPAEVAALQAEAAALRQQVAAFEVRFSSLESRVQEMQALVQALQARPVAASPAAEAPPRRDLRPQVPPAPGADPRARQAQVNLAAAEGRCKVDSCPGAAHRDGFCPDHWRQWRSGALGGFVSPEGLVSVAGAPRRVAPFFAGQAYAVQGDAVWVGAREVPSVGY